MSDWGVRPWENDAAAVWFQQAIANGELPSAVERTLRLDISSHSAEIRSAAAVLILLGRVFTWNGPHFQKHIKLAIARLEEILASGLYSEAPDVVEQISNELQVMHYRLLQLGASVSGEKICPPESLVKWWSTWL